jgi:hypothetical protein
VEDSVHLQTGTLRDSKWSQYALRFLFGGIVTAIAGLVAQHYGPVIAGLLLAFPAIFPASATLMGQVRIPFGSGNLGPIWVR